MVKSRDGVVRGLGPYLLLSVALITAHFHLAPVRTVAQSAAVIGILEPVEEHVVDHLAMADAGAAAHLGQNVGGVGHALHAAGHHD